MNILALDQGTTSTRAIIVNSQGAIVACEAVEFKQHFPKPLWVEHDPEEIYNSSVKAIQKVLKTSKIEAQSIKALGITNQRETTIIWSKKTGKPLCHAIVWQDRRTESLIQELKSTFDEEKLRQKTGLIFDPYFSASKIKWIIDQHPEVLKNPNDYLFGTVESYLVYKLTSGKHHITDITNASRTQLFNIETLEWDETLLKLFNIPSSILPKVVQNTGDFGEVSSVEEIKGLPITALIGDQQAALFGQGCFDFKDAKCTYGTGCFVLVNTGEKRIHSKHRLLTTIAYQVNNELKYALEGSVFMGGATVQWLRDELHFFKNSDEIELLAQKVKDTQGVVLVPSFTGLGAPYWIPHATGTLLGITRGTKKEHIARAALQSIALQVCDIFEAIEQDMGGDGFSLKVDGGATRDSLLMQMQADYLQGSVTISKYQEVTALGASFLAGYKIGLWKSLDEISSHIKDRKKISPSIDKKSSDLHKTYWKQAIECTKTWANLTQKNHR